MKKVWKLSAVAVLLVLTSCKVQHNGENLFEGAPKLVSSQFDFTEGPASDKAGNVYFTDQPNDKIYFWNWKNNQIELFLEKTGRANGTYFDKDDNLITCSDEHGEIWKISKKSRICTVFKQHPI